MTREVAIGGGRVLAVHEAGDPAGPVLLCHHGTPLPGPPFAPWVADAEARGLRLLAYDRPGYGASTPDPGRTVADGARDCAALMDALGVERFATWGLSSGGAYALACAALLGERVIAVAALAPPAPLDAEGLNIFRGMGAENIAEFGLALAGREYIEPVTRQSAAALDAATEGELLGLMTTLVSTPDRAVLDGAFAAYQKAAMGPTLANGVAGWVDDNLTFALPFGFEPSAIAAPTLIVHGRHDRFVPVDHGRWWASHIPGAEAWISEEDGHLTLMTSRVPAVHDWLLTCQEGIASSPAMPSA